MQKNSPTYPELIDRVQKLMGYEFRDPELIRLALTHPSATEHAPLLSYQRLEFLGDAVVGLCVADYAYRSYPEVDEGILTKMRVTVVQGSFLSEKQLEAGFDKLIIFGASEQSASSRGMHRALEDSFESLAGALYLDGGFQIAYDWVMSQLKSYVTPDAVKTAANPKSELQEYVQHKGGVVTYHILDSSGPAHAPQFLAEVLINGVPSGQAAGESKKAAEAAAAASALAKLHRA
ncbi:MAG: ribonuclease III [Coriobacteriia bacterium]|nr:ribonuclease III [Coriobacteriia bacterium]MCL2537820.1 ribonuclease III [Coriobacteriia bacterium]